VEGFTTIVEYCQSDKNAAGIYAKSTQNIGVAMMNTDKNQAKGFGKG